MSERKNCIIFFIKYPEPGMVKTRLGVSIGWEMAAELYKCIVEDIYKNLKKQKENICIFVPAELDIKRFHEWLGQSSVYHRQLGSDLGEKLYNSFMDIFEQGYENIVVIGSDTPDITDGIITEAFSHLKDSDAVIGPSSDGGYYLLGLKRESFSLELFEGISWSTDKVYKQTTNKLDMNGFYTFELPVKDDIDNIDDLKKLKTNSTALRDVCKKQPII